MNNSFNKESDSLLSIISDEDTNFFNDFKKGFSSLNDVYYENGILTFPMGSLTIDEYTLKNILPSTFTMAPNDIYIYLKHKYYLAKGTDIEDIFNLFPQLVITNDEEQRLKDFTLDYWERLNLYNREQPILENDGVFMRELHQRQKVIAESYQRPLMAANIIASTYANKVNEEMNNQAPEKGNNMVKTLSKPGVSQEEIDEALGIGGFAAVLIIIGITLAVGLYIGVRLMT